MRALAAASLGRDIPFEEPFEQLGGAMALALREPLVDEVVQLSRLGRGYPARSCTGYIGIPVIKG